MSVLGALPSHWIMSELNQLLFWQLAVGSPPFCSGELLDLSGHHV